MGVIGYLMYGESLKSQVTLNLPSKNIGSSIAIYTTLINPFTKFALLITPIAEAIEDSLHIGKNRTVSCLHQDCLGRQHNNGGACCAVLCLRRRTNWILPQQYGHDVATLCLLPEDHQFKDFHEAGVGAGNLFGYYHYWVGGYWHRHVQFIATDYS
jgi:hypothetical protein